MFIDAASTVSCDNVKPRCKLRVELKQLDPWTVDRGVT